MALERAVADEASSSDDGNGMSELKFIPRSAQTDAGLAMEMELTRDLRARELEEGDAAGGNFIVDQTQFRNTEVGKGYQHKTVVRQRSATNAARPMKIVDMTQARAPTEKHKDRHKRDDGGDGKSRKTASGKHDKKHHKRQRSAGGDDSASDAEGDAGGGAPPSIEVARPALQELRCLLELKLRAQQPQQPQ
ncbi:hypothetical protein JKP88DRAFT_311523 [Tribonema minus]|uniref:Uncharacterized protein n=1 Tax=Tribonema minus TaxID=303371 RepID=A0A835Z3W9_9STRA|nr:hypothetical protein JKP88DRAFT_311523 [Tribonema minus]